MNYRKTEVPMFLILLTFIVGIITGWQLAHKEVATECEKQGSFYVGNKTFKCNEIKEGGKNG